MLIKSLRSEPEIFDPIKFTTGINFITGERSGTTKSGNKTNGVGKSLLMNFIDFCLLSEYKQNRISQVPDEVLPAKTFIILEFSCEDKDIKIIRSKQEQSTPTIYVNGVIKKFSTLKDAKQYLSENIFGNKTSYSLREMLRAFKRKEKDGFNKIDNPDGNKGSSIIPYLYLFGLNIELHKYLDDKAKNLVAVHKYSAELKKEIEQLDININEAAAYTNELKSQLENINRAVEELSQNKLYDAISEDISNLDIQMEEANIELLSIKEELKQIDNVPDYQEISRHDILAVFNDCKKSLGDIIVREIKEIEEFKRKIDSFKTDVIAQRKIELLSLKQKVSKKIKFLSNEYKKKISVLDKDGNLRSLKTTLHEQEIKRQEYNKICFFFEQYQEQESNKITVKAEREEGIVRLKADKEKQTSVISAFESEVLEIHEYLYGNRRASFDIEIKEAKRIDQKVFTVFHMETDDAGSVRTEHEKILIFDFALLFCPATRKKHTNWIMHDGAFEGVNEDSKFQILNWLYEMQEKDKNFQYIVTINRDSFELLEKNGKFSFDLNKYVRTEYTKNT